MFDSQLKALVCVRWCEEPAGNDETHFNIAVAKRTPSLSVHGLALRPKHSGVTEALTTTSRNL